MVVFKLLLWSSEISHCLSSQKAIQRAQSLNSDQKKKYIFQWLSTTMQRVWVKKLWCNLVLVSFMNKIILFGCIVWHQYAPHKKWPGMYSCHVLDRDKLGQFQYLQITLQNKSVYRLYVWYPALDISELFSEDLFHFRCCISLVLKSHQASCGV